MITDKSRVNLRKPLRYRHLCRIPLGCLFGPLATAAVCTACSPEHLNKDLTERGNLVEERKGWHCEIEIMEGLVSLPRERQNWVCATSSELSNPCARNLFLERQASYWAQRALYSSDYDVRCKTKNSSITLRFPITKFLTLTFLHFAEIWEVTSVRSARYCSKRRGVIGEFSQGSTLSVPTHLPLRPSRCLLSCHCDGLTLLLPMPVSPPGHYPIPWPHPKTFVLVIVSPLLRLQVLALYGIILNIQT